MCVHHFVLESPTPGIPTVSGVCKFCAEVKVYPAYENTEPIPMAQSVKHLFKARPKKHESVIPVGGYADTAWRIVK